MLWDFPTFAYELDTKPSQSLKCELVPRSTVSTGGHEGLHLFAGAELAKDAVRPEPEPPEAETGVRGALRRGRHAAVCEDSGKGSGRAAGFGYSSGVGGEGFPFLVNAYAWRRL